MSAKPGSHTAYMRGADMVVEWYDFGDHAPYESATLLIFGPEAQLRFAELLELGCTPSADPLSSKIAERFTSYFEVRAFADTHGLAYARKVVFWP